MTTTNTFQAQAFIDLALSRGVLKFGEFTLKSGRVSPYFFNAGLLNDGEALALLASGYADQLMQCEGVEVIFGPAYKGIPFVAATAVALAQNHQKSVPWGFNRKEAKDHGEGGALVGAALRGNVLIVDDVITAGTAITDAINIIENAGARPAAVIIGFNRLERGRHSLSATEEIEQQFKIPVISVIDLNDIVDYLTMSGEEELLATMLAYRAKYGVT